jgi:hypothetical protein
MMWQAAAFGVPLFESPAAAFDCGCITPLFGVGFRQESWNLSRMPSIVDRDEREIARIRVAAHTRNQVLRLDADADFHRCAADVVDARLEHDEVAQVDGLAKVDAVDGSSHARGPCVTDRGNGRRLVHERHDDAAEHVAQVVGVLGKHESRRLML